jgi:hypothetical protein
VRLSLPHPRCAPADPDLLSSYSFCGRIGQEYVECLQACEAQTMKTYLEWRVKNWRVKKESTIKSYWKRLSCAYIDGSPSKASIFLTLASMFLLRTNMPVQRWKKQRSYCYLFTRMT